METRIHHHVSHPFVMVSAIVSAVAVVWMGMSFPVVAASTKTYQHTGDSYAFSYPSTWSVKKGSKSVAISPPAASLTKLQKRGVAYTLNATYLNNDPAVFTGTVKSSLSGGWEKFVKAYAASVAKKNAASVTTKVYAKAGWSAAEVTLKKTTSNIVTTWKYMLLSKDKKKVYVVAEKWTKESGSPFALDVKAVVKSFTLLTAAPALDITWTFDGTNWSANSKPPACANPLVIPSPVDVNLASSVLYPGQVRGGNYKPHGGFRFDGQSSSAITVTAPFEAKVMTGARYIENGDVQYLFDLISPCGIRVRFDHLYTLSAPFQALADTLPAAQVDNTQTTVFAQPLKVKAGDVVATGVGEPTTSNTSVDFGVYDLRQRNSISKDASWAASHETIKEMGWYGICWLDNLSASQGAIVRALPAADGQAGATSDYCD